MISEARRLANQQNARHSTGPRTAAGKAVVARNGVRHGVFGRHALLPGEDADELHQLKISLLRRLDPRDELELDLIERMIGSLWKLRRLNRIEQDVVNESPAPADAAAELERFDRFAKLGARLQGTFDRAFRQYSKLREAQSMGGRADFAADAWEEIDERPNDADGLQARESELDEPGIDSPEQLAAANKATVQPPTLLVASKATVQPLTQKAGIKATVELRPPAAASKAKAVTDLSGTNFCPDSLRVVERVAKMQAAIEAKSIASNELNFALDRSPVGRRVA